MVVTCTLTITDDTHVEYEDDLQHRRDKGDHVLGTVGGTRYTRKVVDLLNRWVAANPRRCRRDELMLLGAGLYEMAFGNGPPFSDDAPPLQLAFEKTYDVTRNRMHEPLRLRLVIGGDATTLGRYPWEFLYMPLPNDNGFFLAGESTELRLVRYVPNSDSWGSEGLDDERLRILVVVSKPPIPNMTDVDVDEFVKRMQKLDPSRFRIEPLRNPTKVELSKRIKDLQPHVVHFIGHGKRSELALKKDDSVLATERSEYDTMRELGRDPEPPGEADWINIASASNALRAGLEEKGAPKRLIFLHACEGATPAYTESALHGFTTLAQTLAGTNNVSGVVAMQYAISVTDAEVFASSFYHFVCDGFAMDEAVSMARKEFAETPIPGEQSWDSPRFGTPVVYLRDEQPLVARRAKAGNAADEQRRDDEGEGAPAKPLGKENCPNPACASGFVIRSAKPNTCRLCHESFVPCPNDSCTGLVVPKVDYQCTMCEFVFSTATRPDDTTGARSAGPGEGAAHGPSAYGPREREHHRSSDFAVVPSTPDDGSIWPEGGQ